MSDRFTLDGIEDVFRDDVLRLTSTMRSRLEHLQKDPEDPRAIEDVRLTGHSLRGTASLVGLTYLAQSGAVYERMAEVGATFASSEPSQARAIYAVMQAGLDIVERLLAASLRAGEEDEQERLYGELRDSFPPPLRAYLPEEPVSGAAGTVRGARREEAEPATSAEERRQDDEDAFASELAEAFASELQEQVLNIPGELVLLDSPMMRQAASARLNRVFHTIKGSAAMVGLGSLSETARRLEEFFSEPGIAMSAAVAQAQQDIETLFAAAGASAPQLPASVLTAEVPRPAGELELERELLEAFNVDASEGIERCEQLLLDLEQQPSDREMLHALFREFHTLKGAAGAVGLENVAAQLHEGESLLESVLEGEIRVDAGRLVDFLFRLTDSIVALIQRARGIHDPRRQVMTDLEEAIAELGAPAAEAPVEAEPAVSEPAAAAPLEPRAAQETEAGIVRVQAARLDALLNQVGQLVVTRTRMDEKVESFGELRDRLEYCRRRLTDTIENFQRRFEFTIGDSHLPRLRAPDAAGAPAAGYGAGVDDFFTDLEFDKYDDFNILARSVIELASDTGEVADQLDHFIEDLGEEVRQFSKITSGLQRMITHLRLVPIDVVFRRLLRPVRDAARQEGKLVDLQFHGGDVQLDRGVTEALYTPLLHIVRNAVSHGIERPAVREANGKPRTGTVRITATARHNSVTLAVADDGSGLDYDAIRAKAVGLGLLDAAAATSREQLLSFIFRPGFSTADTVTDLSGRGVGMDVVARQVTALNGSVLVDSKEGEGTTIRLALPITTSIDEVLLLETGQQVYALPVDFVERVVAVEQHELQQVEGRWVLPIEDEQVPALFLAGLVGEAPPAGSAVGVVLRAGERAMVLVVDQVRGQQEVVIRPLSPLLEAHPFLSASTISGSGTVIFVLHVGRLFEILGMAIARALRTETGRGATEVAEPLVPSRAILVVDDSISVRKLAVRFLESEGLEVDTAVDGVDALEKLMTGAFRVVVTDLEMPRMHGYDLIEAIKSNAKLSHLPVIVCTSRSSEKHRRRAHDLGAEGYLTKPFSKEEIVAEIMRVTEWREHSVALAQSTDE